MKALEELREAAQAMVDFSLSRDEVRRINPAVLREFVARKRALRKALERCEEVPLNMPIEPSEAAIAKILGDSFEHFRAALKEAYAVDGLAITRIQHFVARGITYDERPEKQGPLVREMWRLLCDVVAAPVEPPKEPPVILVYRVGGARGDTTPDVGASVPAPRREP